MTRIVHANEGPERVVTSVIPFEKGEWFGQPLETQRGFPVQARSFGAPWPDGSSRYALAVFRVAGSDEIRAATSRAAPEFVWHPSLHLFRLQLGLTVGGRTIPFTDWILDDDGPVAKRYCGVLTHGSLYARLDVEAQSSMPWARIWLRVGFATESAELFFAPQDVSLWVSGARVELWHGRDPNRLWAPGTLADGMSFAVTGMLVFGTENAPLCDHNNVLVHGWVDSGAFGPWGVVPWVEGDPWVNIRPLGVLDPPVYGLNANPWGVADQADFSSVVMSHEAREGFLGRLEWIQQSVLQEALRPTHVLHHGQLRDGRMIDPSPKHRTLARSETPHQWWGRDEEHFTVNYLATYAMMTGDVFAMQEVHHVADLWLGEFVPSIGLRPARAVGRFMQAGVLLWLVTGRVEILRRMAELVQVVLAEWVGRGVGPVRPLTLGPQRDVDEHGWPTWRPWEQAIAIRGLSAVYAHMQSEQLRDLIDKLGHTLLEYGMRKNSDGKWQVAWVVRWNDDGSPVDEMGSDWKPAENLLGWAASGLVAWSAVGGASEQRAQVKEIAEQARSELAPTKAAELIVV